MEKTDEDYVKELRAMYGEDYGRDGFMSEQLGGQGFGGKKNVKDTELYDTLGVKPDAS